ncbi:DUF3077 domain-containing protein [Pseudomonas syringae]|uniref:DUF3077 domain-containing protein n=1 Tax=Pseudomonas syringae TaxID=317 RepID=A0A085V6W0_PSESX|nr:DUF3077 domain-containing protein [Pseudomonas syringae]KFE51173.1 hypothetical protein IV02_13240 [Pseudomonas syringae]
MNLHTIKTIGTTTFANCGEDKQPLLRLNPNVPTEHALEHVAALLTCINELTLDAAMGESGLHATWAAHYLGEMAKAIVDDSLASFCASRLMDDQ